MDMDFYCSHCKKQYASYKSLWNHNKKFHNTGLSNVVLGGSKKVVVGGSLVVNTINTKQNTIQPDTCTENKLLICKFCNRKFNDRSNRWKHEKICKTKEELKEEKEKDRILEEQKLEIELKNKEVEALKLKLKISKKTSNKETALSVQKINKALQMHHSNINSHNNITNNQHIVQNFQLIQLGKEQDIPLLLTNQEKSSILNSRRFALKKIVELLHGGSGNYKQFKNLIITNLRNKYIYKYDETKDAFILASSDDVMELLIDSRLSDLETIYDQYNHKISDITKKSLERFINEMREQNSDSRNFEIEQIKMLLFNDRDKIMTDLQDEISLVLTVNEVD